MCAGVLWAIDTKMSFPFGKHPVLDQHALQAPPNPTPTPFFKAKAFSDTKMNITFSYPENLIVTKINDKMLWVHTANQTDEKNSLLIYTTKVTKKTTEVTAPFKIDGSITQSMKIRKEGFNARLVTFSAAAEHTQVFFFRSNTQVIICRPPQANTFDPNEVFAIIDSIHVIK